MTSIKELSEEITKRTQLRGRKVAAIALTVVVLASIYLPFVHAGMDFSIDLLVAALNSYNIGDHPRLWARVLNTGTVTIQPYHLHGVFTVTAPTNPPTVISAGDGYCSGGNDPAPGGICVIENTDHYWTIPIGAVAGIYSIQVIITESSTGASRSASNANGFSVNAPPPPDYSVQASPSTLTVSAGQQASFTVTVTATNGWNSPVTLDWANGPPDATDAKFSPNPVTPTSSGATSTLTFTSYRVGHTFPFTIEGTSGTKLHTWSGSSVTIEQSNPTDYQLSLSPSSATLAQGSSTPFTLTATASGSYSSTVTLQALALNGMTVTFSGSTTTTIAPTTSGATKTVTVSVAADAIPGQTYFLIMGQDPGGNFKQTSARILITSSVQGISLKSQSTDKSSYSSSETVQFTFTITNTRSPVTVRPVVAVLNTGSWQGERDTILQTGDTIVRISAPAPGAWEPGTKTWGVTLLGPPPSYRNVVLYQSPTATFTITGGSVYSFSISAQTVGGGSDGSSHVPIYGAEIYIATAPNSPTTGYRRYLTSSSGSTAYATPGTYQIVALQFRAGDTFPTLGDGSTYSGYLFDHWEYSGGATVSPATSASATLTVTGSSGKIVAVFIRLQVNFSMQSLCDTTACPAPAPNHVIDGQPTSVTASASIQIVQQDLSTDPEHGCLSACSATLYLRAYLEGWGSDGNLDIWMSDPSSGLRSYTLSMSNPSTATFTWVFSSLSPTPLPGTYSLGLFVLNGNTVSGSFPSTTGPVAFSLIQFAFAFDNGASYAEIYGNSQYRIIHLHWDNSFLQSCSSCTTVQGMLQKLGQVQTIYAIAGLTTTFAGGLSKGLLVFNDLAGIASGLCTIADCGNPASRQADGYDLVIYQTLSDANQNKGKFFQVPLTLGASAKGRDQFLTGLGVALDVITIVLALALFATAPPLGVAFLVAEVGGGVAGADLVLNAQYHDMNIPAEISMFSLNGKKAFEDGQDLPAYGCLSGSTCTWQSRAASIGSSFESVEPQGGALPQSAPNNPYGPDGSAYTGITINSVTPSQIVTAPGSSVSITVNYQTWESPAQGQDMQLALLQSWGGGWPPINYVGITGGAGAQQETVTFTVTMPQTAGTYYAWLGVGLGSTYTQAVQPFNFNLLATSTPHVTIQVISGWSLLDGLSPDAPGLAASSARLFMGARSTDNTIWYRDMDSTGAWSGWVKLPGFTDAKPAVVVFNSNLYVFAKGAGTNNIWYGYYPLSAGVVSGSFSGWTLLPGPSPAAVGLATDGSYLYVAAEAPDGTIWIRRMATSGVWSGWTQIPGLTDVSPAIVVFQNQLYFVCKQRSSNNMWYGYVSLVSYPGGWSGWVLLPGPTPDALTLTVSSDHLYVAARGMDSSIWYRSMDSSGSWSGWSSLPGYTSSPIGICVYSASLWFAAREAGTNNLWTTNRPL